MYGPRRRPGAGRIAASWLIAVSALAAGAPARAAPCCAGGSAAPSLIAGDDEAQLTLTTAYSSAIGEAQAEDSPIFYGDDYSETRRLARLDGAVLLSDRFQAGASVRLVSQEVQRSGLGENGTRLGDFAADLGYEILPEYGYSSWRPRGFLFLEATLPTGRSRWESASSTRADVTGTGLYAVGLGGLFVKRWSYWDAYLLPELHYAFSRGFADPLDGTAIQVGAGGGASAAFGVGVSPGAGPFRVGVSVAPVYESSRSVDSAVGSSALPYKLSWDSALEMSYLIASQWSIMGTYTDQTLLGPVSSTSLTRTFALAVQRRWER